MWTEENSEEEKLKHYKLNFWSMCNAQDLYWNTVYWCQDSLTTQSLLTQCLLAGRETWI